MPAHELEFSTFPHGHYVDLMPYQYGREACEPGHAFGPARRSHFLFHYIISGRGLLMSTDENGVKSDHPQPGQHLCCRSGRPLGVHLGGV